jgi:glutamine amidotransferase
MRLLIVNSGVGNVRSVANMLKRLRVEAEISDDAHALARAEALILPGVGSFDAAMQRMRARGLKSALDDLATSGRTPILGICLGMQLLGDGSEEGAEHGFGWIPGVTRRLLPQQSGGRRLRVPHMGWNLVESTGENVLYQGIQGTPRFYFDHSYHLLPRDPTDVCGIAEYGIGITASVRRGLIFGVQFHPEKSHRFGLSLLGNFVSFARARVCSEASA